MGSPEEWNRRKAPLLCRALRQSLQDYRKGITAGSGAATASRKRARSNSFSSPIASSSSSASSASEKRQKRPDAESADVHEKEPDFEDPLVVTCRPMFRFACIADSIQQNLKDATASGSSSSSSSSTLSTSSASSSRKSSSAFDSGLSHDDQVIVEWSDKFVPVLEGDLATGNVTTYIKALGLTGASAKEIEECAKSSS